MTVRMLIAVLLILVPGPASAGVFVHDDRVTDVASNWPVGIVGSMWFKYGSGFLIDPCHVLTARHAVGSNVAVGKRTRFRLQPWTLATKVNSSKGTVIAAGAGVAGGPEDWAAIKLDRCLGDTFGFFPIAKAGFYTMGGTARLRPDLVAMGYPADRGRHNLSVDPQCQARLRTTQGMLHDCATLPGNSGGPLLTWNEADKRFEAVGIAVASRTISKIPVHFTLESANVAVDLTMIRPSLGAVGLAATPGLAGPSDKSIALDPRAFAERNTGTPRRENAKH